LTRFAPNRRLSDNSSNVLVPIIAFDCQIIHRRKANGKTSRNMKKLIEFLIDGLLSDRYNLSSALFQTAGA
jgi:hypothetical protein